MKYSAQGLRSVLVGAWAIATALHCAADTASSNVETLIGNDRWQEASRTIFLEAKSANKFEWSIPLGQAKAGFLDDALDSISEMHPNTQAGALLNLVENTPSISPSSSLKLIQKTLELVRAKSGESANELKSGELAEIALFYSKRGEEGDARTIFEEAIKAAKSGKNDPVSVSYRRITEALSQDPKGSRTWMISLVASHLLRQEKTADAAFAYINLAQVAARHNENQLASELIETGISAATAISNDSLRRSALERLGDIAVNAGNTRGASQASPYQQAIQEARSGNPQKALAIASGLSENLYVDHGQSTHRRIFEDAVMREDIKTARYFADNPVRPVSWTQANIWRQMAELHAKKGAKQDTAKSYLRAKQAITDKADAVVYFEEINSMLSLAASMRRNGFEVEAREATLDALAMSERISERRTDDWAKAATLVAEALWHHGMHSDAKHRILLAYRAANEYSDKIGMEKARLLSEIGRATSTFMFR